MVRACCTIFGICLIILAFDVLLLPADGAESWIAWVGGIAGLASLTLARTLEPSRTRAYRASIPGALAVVLLVAGYLALHHDGWIARAWLTLVFGLFYGVLALLAATEGPDLVVHGPREHRQPHHPPRRRIAPEPSDLSTDEILDRYGTHEIAASDVQVRAGYVDDRPESRAGAHRFLQDDLQIADEISRRLAAHPELDERQIEVSVRLGDVTLRGTVPAPGQRRLAETLCASVPGVNAVHNRLQTTARTAA